MNRAWLTAGWIARIILAAIFCYAAQGKIVAPAAFAENIYYFRILPDAWVNVAAVFLPWLELVAAVALFFPRFRDGAAVLLAILLLIFLGALGSAILRDLDISCGCFSQADGAHKISPLLLVRNVGLIALCGVSWLAGRRTVGTSNS